MLPSLVISEHLAFAKCRMLLSFINTMFNFPNTFKLAGKTWNRLNWLSQDRAGWMRLGGAWFSAGSKEE